MFPVSSQPTRAPRRAFKFAALGLALVVVSTGLGLLSQAPRTDSAYTAVSHASTQNNKAEGIPPFATVTVGKTHALALTEDNVLYSWGENDYGQLGNGTTEDSSFPTAINLTGPLAGKTITQLTSHYYHSTALTSEGDVYYWGNYFTQANAGFPGPWQSELPIKADFTGILQTGETVTKVTDTVDATQVLTTKGRVFSWGHNIYGTVGNGTNTPIFTPTPPQLSGVLAGKTVTDISASIAAVFVTLSDGSVASWGVGTSGELGTGNTQSSPVPVSVLMNGALSGKKLVRVAAGAYVGYALDSNGVLYSWGTAVYNTLGTGVSTGRQLAPTSVNSFGALNNKAIVDFDTGIHVITVRASDGKLYSWGRGDYGKLGIGPIGSPGSPVPVAVDMTGALAGKQITKVASGESTVFAYNPAEARWYWWGSSLQLLGTEDQYVPALFPEFTRFIPE